MKVYIGIFKVTNDLVVDPDELTRITNLDLERIAAFMHLPIMDVDIDTFYGPSGIMFLKLLVKFDDSPKSNEVKIDTTYIDISKLNASQKEVITNIVNHAKVYS